MQYTFTKLYLLLYHSLFSKDMSTCQSSEYLAGFLLFVRRGVVVVLLLDYFLLVVVMCLLDHQNLPQFGDVFLVALV